MTGFIPLNLEGLILDNTEPILPGMPPNIPSAPLNKPPNPCPQDLGSRHFRSLKDVNRSFH